MQGWKKWTLGASVAAWSCWGAAPWQWRPPSPCTCSAELCTPGNRVWPQAHLFIPARCESAAQQGKRTVGPFHPVNRKTLQTSPESLDAHAMPFLHLPLLFVGAIFIPCPSHCCGISFLGYCGKSFQPRSYRPSPQLSIFGYLEV